MLYAKSRISEIKINKNASTNVNLKISPSKPRLLDEVDSPPHTLPNPVPFTCRSTTAESKTEIIICNTKRACCMSVSIAYHFLSQFMIVVTNHINSENAKYANGPLLKVTEGISINSVAKPEK